MENEPDEPAGVIHEVGPGETLWRIAHSYGVPLEEIVRANDIEDPERIEAGRSLFIPGAMVPLDIEPYPAPLHPGPAAPSQRPTGPAVVEGRFLWPVAGGEILSGFGSRRRRHRHAGLDLRGQRGQEISASAGGVVKYSGPTRTGYGRLVVVDHGGGTLTLYGHADRLLVRTGDTVSAGDVIGTVGRSGNATTDHCHFEIRRDGVAVDPLPLLGRPEKCEGERIALCSPRHGARPATLSP